MSPVPWRVMTSSSQGSLIERAREERSKLETTMSRREEERLQCPGERKRGSGASLSFLRTQLVSGAWDDGPDVLEFRNVSIVAMKITKTWLVQMRQL